MVFEFLGLYLELTGPLEQILNNPLETFIVEHLSESWLDVHGAINVRQV